jgi:hypothetical protein
MVGDDRIIKGAEMASLGDRWHPAGMRNVFFGVSGGVACAQPPANGWKLGRMGTNRMVEKLGAIVN